MRWALGWLVVWGCGETTTPDAPSYEVDVAPILAMHCVRCHTSSGRRDGGVELDRYASARSSRIRAACTALDEGVIAQYADVLVSAAAEPGDGSCEGWPAASMPPGAVTHLSRTEQLVYAQWIATEAGP